MGDSSGLEHSCKVVLRKKYFLLRLDPKFEVGFGTTTHF